MQWRPDNFAHWEKKSKGNESDGVDFGKFTLQVNGRFVVANECESLLGGHLIDSSFGCNNVESETHTKNEEMKTDGQIVACKRTHH